MSPRRGPPRSDDHEPDDRDEDQKPGSALDTIEAQQKLSGRRRPAPSRGVDAILDKTVSRRDALVVGALPAHVEIIFDPDRAAAFTREDVHIVRVHPALIAVLQSPLVVGDRVSVAELQNGQLYAVDALPRTTILARPAVAREKHPQSIVSNAEVLWVVVAIDDPPMNPGLIDRFFVAAAAGGLTPRLCITKADLPDSSDGARWRELYERIGFTVVRTSVRGEIGLAEMRAALAGHFSVLVGQSGVGKSSIVRAILPEQPIAIAEVSIATGKGRHTTTVTRYYRLPEGGAVVDTPGLRELGLWNANRSHLNAGFPDIAELAQGCRFADCHHEQEPGCAVRAATDLPAERLASFRKLSQEIDQRLRPGFGKPGGPTVLR